MFKALYQTPMQSLVAISAFIQLVCLIFGLAASGGGAWTYAVCLNVDTTAQIYDAYTFGLTEYKAVDLDNKKIAAFVFKYDTEIKGNTRYELDLSYLRHGGTWASTMLAFGIITLVVSVLGHLCIFPFGVAPILQNYAHASQIIAGVLFTFSCLMWSALGDTATRHTMVDIIVNCNVPKAKFGWSYDLVGLCAAVTLLNAFILGRVIHKRLANGDQNVKFDNTQRFSTVEEGIGGQGATYGTGGMGAIKEDQQDMNYGNADL